MDFERLTQRGSSFDEFGKLKDGMKISAIWVELR
jgi:hypothetical protein